MFTQKPFEEGIKLVANWLTGFDIPRFPGSLIPRFPVLVIALSVLQPLTLHLYQVRRRLSLSIFPSALKFSYNEKRVINIQRNKLAVHKRNIFGTYVYFLFQVQGLQSTLSQIEVSKIHVASKCINIQHLLQCFSFPVV